MKRRIFHLQIIKNNKHKYYGSLQAVFNDSTNPNLGVSKFTLDRYDFTNPYENDIIILRKGEMLSSTDAMKNKKTGKKRGQKTNT